MMIEISRDIIKSIRESKYSTILEIYEIIYPPGSPFTPGKWIQDLSVEKKTLFCIS